MNKAKAMIKIRADSMPPEYEAIKSIQGRAPWVREASSKKRNPLGKSQRPTASQIDPEITVSER
jgi:hypothetical protein